MSKIVRAVAGAGLVVAGALTGNVTLIIAGAQLTASALLSNGAKNRREAQVATLSIGEGPREAVFGETLTGGSLLDAFNYGGKYGTDWEVLVIALADHLCDALVGFYVGDTFVAFAGNGDVAGYRGQLRVRWYRGTDGQAADPVLVAQGRWAATDRLSGICYIVVEYRADATDAKNPVWPGGRPSFQWQLRGKRCYIPMLDSTVPGGAGPHRWTSPETWAWTDNLAVCRYNWVRGIYAGDRVTEPGQLLIGRGLSAIEAPPERVAPHAALCAEPVGLAGGGSEPRYRCSAVIGADEQFDVIEAKFAAACGGVITQPEGSVEVEPGHAKAIVANITDDDLLIGEPVTFSLFRSEADDEWCNSVVATYPEPKQQWKDHAAPIRRVYADIVADGRPRERRLDLEYVTSGTQAQRCAEIARRLGRLTATGGLSLGPRFCELEEGDWITYTSARRTRGQTLTFRIDAYQGDASWRTKLTLRQIAASAFGWTPTDEVAEGAVAVQQARPADAAFVTSRAAHQLLGGDVEYPITTTADTIAVGAFRATLDDGRIVDFPAGQVGGLTNAANYRLFYALEDFKQPMLGTDDAPLLGASDQPLTMTVFAGSYVAVAMPALAALANSSLEAIRRATTAAADGSYPPVATPPAGDGGTGYGGGGRYVDDTASA